MPEVVKKIEYSRRFLRSLQRMPARVIAQAVEKEKIFRENSFDPRLRTHKLHGKEKGAWAFSISKSHRIKFIFLKEGTVLFLDVGMHKIYK